MGRKNNKQLLRRDFRNGMKMYDDKRRPIQDLYMERIKAMSKEIQTKPIEKRSKIYHLKEEDIQNMAYEQAMSEVEGRLDLKELQGKFYRNLAKSNKMRKGEWREFD